MVDTAVVVTILIFLLGLAFYSGRLSARLEALEGWRGEMRSELARIIDKLDEIRRLALGTRV